MSEINENTYIALQMACELRAVMAKKCKSLPHLGLPEAYPLEPIEGESFDDACRRIFGGYIYDKVMYDRAHPDKKYPERFYKNWEPKGPDGVRRKSLSDCGKKFDFCDRDERKCGPHLKEDDPDG